MSNEIFLYWGSGSPPCWRVQIVLDEKNISYGNKMLSFDKKEHKSEEIMKLNPRGQLPTLKVGDFTINESLAACLYFEDQYKSQGTCLIPQESKSKAHVLQKAFEALNLQKYCNENIVYYLWKTASNEIDQAYLSGKKKELNKEFERWETYLNEQNSSFIATNDFTLADAFFYPQLALAVRMGYPLQDKYKKLNDYYESVKQRPSIQNNWPPHWKQSPNSTVLADC